MSIDALNHSTGSARRRSTTRWLFAVLCLGACSISLSSSSTTVPKWWDLKAYRDFAAYATFDNAWGKLGVLNTSGKITAADNAFLTPMGPFGRACVTCHQPGNAMSVSVDSLRAQWDTGGMKNPVFAAVDGSNCPNLPQELRSSHSLLVDHGLFRVTRPWPPRDLAGTPLEPEFSIEVVKDPTGCNLDPKYGLSSATPTISVYRRPRLTANETFVTAEDTPPNAIIGNKSGLPRDRDPTTGKFIFLPILADGGQPSISRQTNAAAGAHMGLSSTQKPLGLALTQAQLDQIHDFLMQVFVAQDVSTAAGDLRDTSGPTALGTSGYAGHTGLASGMVESHPVFGSLDAWRYQSPKTEQEKFRASVARGYDIFYRRPLLIRDSAGFNDIGMGNPYKRTCAICHNGLLSGIDTSPGFMDIGTQNLPAADPAPYLPLFKLTCKKSAAPHSYLGRVIYTHDPGRALISGRCADIGLINLSQIRGLAARAPYVSNGTAKDLMAVVTFYDRRFVMHMTEQDKSDLVNFLSVL